MTGMEDLVLFNKDVCALCLCLQCMAGWELICTWSFMDDTFPIYTMHTYPYMEDKYEAGGSTEWTTGLIHQGSLYVLSLLVALKKGRITY